MNPLPPQGPLLFVCAWCPDKAEQDALAARHGLRVTHGICDACRDRQLAELFPPPTPAPPDRVEGRAYLIELKRRQVAHDLTSASFFPS